MISHGDMPRRIACAPCILIAMALVVIALNGAAANGAGNEFALEAYRGKVVVLDFWASWCLPCRRSFPWMNEMQRKYADAGLVFVGVNLDASPDDAQAFLREFPAAFRIVADPDGELAMHYAVAAMPSSYIIDRDGTIVASHLGFQLKKIDEYEENIRQVLFINED